MRISAGAEGLIEELVATGRHRVACMRRDGTELVPAAIPDELRAAVLEYR